jgi:hypothetical protein
LSLAAHSWHPHHVRGIQSDITIRGLLCLLIDALEFREIDHLALAGVIFSPICLHPGHLLALHRDLFGVLLRLLLADRFLQPPLEDLLEPL